MRLFDLEEKKRLGRGIMAHKNLNRNNVTHGYNIWMGFVISVVIWFGCFWLVGFGWFSRVMTLLLGLSKAVIWFIKPRELIVPNLGLARLFPLWLLDHCLPSRRHVPSRCSFLYRRCHWGYCRIVHKMIRKVISVTASGWLQLSYCQVRRDRFQLIALQVVFCRGFFFLSLLFPFL